MSDSTPAWFTVGSKGRCKKQSQAAAPVLPDNGCNGAGSMHAAQAGLLPDKADGRGQDSPLAQPVMRAAEGLQQHPISNYCCSVLAYAEHHWPGPAIEDPDDPALPQPWRWQEVSHLVVLGLGSLEHSRLLHCSPPPLSRVSDIAIPLQVPSLVPSWPWPACCGNS